MKPSTLLLTQRDIAQLVDERVAIRAVRSAFEAMARGEAFMPSKVYLPLPRQSDFRAMPAFLQHPACCGIKWVNVHPENRRKRLPTVMALIVLNDPTTGVPLAVMDGLLVTKLRTAAAAAVAAQTLARPESRTVALVGCGAQADAQLQALTQLLTLSQANVWGFRRGEARAFAARMARRLPSVRVEPFETVEGCVAGADIVVTLTPSRRPLVQHSWLAPGVHVNAVGADGPGKQELEPNILREATVVVDEREQAIHGGELNVPVARGEYDPAWIHATLGEILIGRKPGRRSKGEMTVFDSTGLAVHDIALGAEILRRARRRQIGRRIRFFEGL